jgi:hypothetical protein
MLYEAWNTDVLKECEMRRRRWVGSLDGRRLKGFSWRMGQRGINKK